MDASNSSWEAPDTEGTVFLNVSYGADSARAAVFNLKLQEEFNSGHVREAISLVKMDLGEEWVSDFLRRYPWIMLSSVKFTRCDDFTPTAAGDSKTQASAAAAANKRKRRRKQDAEVDGYQYCLIYFGRRKLEFYQHFEKLGIAPGLNSTTYHNPGPLAPPSNVDTPATAAASPSFINALGQQVDGSEVGGVGLIRRTGSVSSGMGMTPPATSAAVEAAIRRAIGADTVMSTESAEEQQLRQDQELLDQYAAAARNVMNHKRQKSTGEQLARQGQAQQQQQLQAQQQQLQAHQQQQLQQQLADPVTAAAAMVATASGLPLGITTNGGGAHAHFAPTGSETPQLDESQFLQLSPITAPATVVPMDTTQFIGDPNTTAGLARELQQLAQGMPAQEISPQMAELLIQHLTHQHQAASSTTSPPAQTTVAPELISPPPQPAVDPFVGHDPNSHIDMDAMQGGTTDFDLLHNGAAVTLNSP